MFEFIGMAVVAWFGFVIVKAILNGSRNAMLSKGVTYARLSGVPTDFSHNMLIFTELVEETRRELGRADYGYRGLAMHEQYGKVLIELHDRAREVEARRVGEEVRAIFQRQADQLYNYGPCYISAMYIIALAQELAKTDLKPHQLKKIFEHCFDHPDHAISRRVAWDELGEREGVKHGLTEMISLVRREVATGKFNYFQKLRSKYLIYHELGLTEHKLANSDPHWYLKIENA